MENCKGCRSNKLIRNGKTSQGVQRYKCKECGGTYGEGDRRLKHGLKTFESNKDVLRGCWN